MQPEESCSQLTYGPRGMPQAQQSVGYVSPGHVMYDASVMIALSWLARSKRKSSKGAADDARLEAWRHGVRNVPHPSMKLTFWCSELNRCGPTGRVASYLWNERRRSTSNSMQSWPNIDIFGRNSCRSHLVLMLHAFCVLVFFVAKRYGRSLDYCQATVSLYLYRS